MQCISNPPAMPLRKGQANVLQSVQLSSLALCILSAFMQLEKVISSLKGMILCLISQSARLI